MPLLTASRGPIPVVPRSTTSSSSSSSSSASAQPKTFASASAFMNVNKTSKVHASSSTSAAKPASSSSSSSSVNTKSAPVTAAAATISKPVAIKGKLNLVSASSIPTTTNPSKTDKVDVQKVSTVKSTPNIKAPPAAAGVPLSVSSSSSSSSSLSKSTTSLAKTAIPPSTAPTTKVAASGPTIASNKTSSSSSSSSSSLVNAVKVNVGPSQRPDSANVAPQSTTRVIPPPPQTSTSIKTGGSVSAVLEKMNANLTQNKSDSMTTKPTTITATTSNNNNNKTTPKTTTTSAINTTSVTQSDKNKEQKRAPVVSVVARNGSNDKNKEKASPSIITPFPSTAKRSEPAAAAAAALSEPTVSSAVRSGAAVSSASSSSSSSSTKTVAKTTNTTGTKTKTSVADEKKGKAKTVEEAGCAIWTPWKWDAFPPRSRVFSGPVQNHTVSRSTEVHDPVPSSEEEKLRTPTKWAFEFQEGMNRSAEQLTNKAQADTCYNVFLTLATTTPADVKTDPNIWCWYLRAQHTRIFAACAFIISKSYPQGTYRRFVSPSVLTECKLIGTPAAADYEPLINLLGVLRGANTIYVLNVKHTFGVLRSTPQDVVDLRDLGHMPYHAIDTGPDVLRPEPTHLWYGSKPHMNPNNEFRRPTVKDASSFTKPTVIMEPDETWQPIADWKSEFDPSQATKSVDLGVNDPHVQALDGDDQGMPDRNTRPMDPFDDVGPEWQDFKNKTSDWCATTSIVETGEEQTRAEACRDRGETDLQGSTMWRSTLKPVQEGYVPSDLLAMLGPRTVSLVRDLTLGGFADRSPQQVLTALAAWNQGRSCWTSCRRARDNLPPLWMSNETNRVNSSEMVDTWIKFKRLRNVCATLMHEAAVLADICTSVYSLHHDVLIEKRVESKSHTNPPSSASSTTAAPTTAAIMRSMEPRTAWYLVKVSLSTFGVWVVHSDATSQRPLPPPSSSSSMFQRPRV